MENKKIDVRSRYTQGIIKQAYLELLEENDEHNVTVAAICKRAQINRGTFYNHFIDILDVQKTIENELFEEIANTLNSNKANSLNLDFYLSAIKIISDNKILFTSVFKNIQGNMFFKNLIDYSKNKYVRDFKEAYPNVSECDIDTMFAYVLHGSIGILAEWFSKNETIDSDKVAKEICYYNDIIIQSFLKSKK